MAGEQEEIEAFRAAGHRLVDELGDYLAQLDKGPVFTPMTLPEREELLSIELPRTGADYDALLEIVTSGLLTRPMGNGHPRFFGWVNSPPSLAGVLGSFVSSAVNPSCAGGDHAGVYLEHAVVRWIAELCGFPLGYGLLASGGSTASLACLAAARHFGARQAGFDDRSDGLLGRDGQRLALYVSSETHSCVRKAAELLGIGNAGTRIVPASNEGYLDPADLRERLRADRKEGYLPFCVAASAGTVGTGVIDPLEELADLCATEGLWFHVDGAYGAFGILDPSIAHRYRGMERADSLAVDPHKWLGVPIDCGCVLVKDGANLRDTFSLVPPYLRTEEGSGFGGPPWFSEFGMEQTRPYRSLKAWMTIAQRGHEGLVALVSRCHALAVSLSAMIEDDARLRLAAGVETSIVAFRYVGEQDASDDELDALQRRIVNRVQERGRAFVTGAIVQGREVLRACILSDRTNEEDLKVLLEEICLAGTSLQR